MKSFLAFSILLLITTVTAFSQVVFKNGYIIKSGNDTVYGLIEYKGNKTNANVCVFKKDAESEAQSFTPNDISGYRLEDSKYYVAKTVTVNEKEELVFLEYLIDGIVDMFYYFDGVSGHFFVDGGDNRLVELRNNPPKEYITTYTKRAIPNSKQHIGVLKYVFRNSPEISKRVETIELDRKSLIDVAHAYHKEVCADEACIIFEKKKPNEFLKFGIMAGINIVSLSKPGNLSYEYIYFTNSDFGTVLCPSAGFFVKLNLPDINAHMFLQYQGTISKMSLQTNNWFTPEGSDWEHHERITYSQSSFNSVAVIKYEFGEGMKFRPNINAGGFFNFGFGDTYSRRSEVYESGKLIGSFYGLEYPFRQDDFGPVAGIGFVTDISEKNAILVDFQYQRGLQLTEVMKANFFSLNIGFQF